MIKNQTIHINSDEIENITPQAQKNNFYLVNLDGRNIESELDYIAVMFKEFTFTN